MAGFPRDIAGGDGNLNITTFQSPNFVDGTDGWQLTLAGALQANNAVIRGIIQAATFIGVGGGAEILLYSSEPPAEGGTGTLVLSVSSVAGTDDSGYSYGAGVYLYGADGAVMALSFDGEFPVLAMRPPGVTHMTEQPLVFSSAENPGQANEFQWLVMSSGKNGGADAALQLNSQSADSSIGANATLEFGGVVVATFNTGGITTHVAFTAPGLPSTPASVQGSAVIYGAGGGTLQVVDGIDGEAYGTERRSVVTTTSQLVSSTTFGSWAQSQVGPRTYRIHGQAYITPNQNAGQMALQWSGPPGTTGLISFVFLEGVNSWSAGPKASGAAANPGITMSSSLVYVCQFDGAVTIASGGTLAIQAANVTGGDTFNIAAASFVDIMPV